MKLAVIDVGSNSVKLQMLDAYPGAPPLPTRALSSPVRLSESLDEHGAITPAGTRALVAAVAHCAEVAREHGAAELIVFATQAIRHAENGAAVCSALRDDAGVPVQELTGEDEARLTFLAARRWLGWSGGRLLVLDIGGGSFEIAYGRDEDPSLAVSLPLGAGELTRTYLPDDRPRPRQMTELRRHVKRTIGDVADVQAARPAQWRTRSAKGSVRAAHRPALRCAPVGGPPGGDGHEAPVEEVRRRAQPRASDRRRCGRGRHRDASPRHRGARDLPLGVARGSGAAPPRPAARTERPARRGGHPGRDRKLTLVRL